MIYLCDIDGTIADLSHRLHFIEQKPADWGSFFAACCADLPIPEVIEVIRALSSRNSVIMVSGRSDECEEKTLEWLRDNAIPFTTIYMRKAGDHRQDNIVKAELLEEIREDWKEDSIAGVFEDRQQVVDMYRAQGLRVFQVAEGKF